MFCTFCLPSSVKKIGQMWGTEQKLSNFKAKKIKKVIRQVLVFYSAMKSEFMVFSNVRINLNSILTFILFFIDCNVFSTIP